MDSVSRDKLKQKGFKRLINSFKFANDGIKYAFKYEQNIIVHLTVAIIVLFAGFFFNISVTEWLIIFMAIGLVVATELINTSIEALVDLASPNINDLAKIAKDTAAGAVLVFAITASIVGIIIFLPKIILLLQGGSLWEVALLV